MKTAPRMSQQQQKSVKLGGRRALLSTGAALLVAAKDIPAAQARRAQINEDTINSRKSYAPSKPLMDTYAKGATWKTFEYKGSEVKYVDIVVGTGTEDDIPQSGNGVMVTTVARASEIERTFDSKKNYEFPVDFEFEDKTLLAGRGLDLALMGYGDEMPPMMPGGKRLIITNAEVANGGRGVACFRQLEQKCFAPPTSDIEVYVEYFGISY